MGVQTVVLTTTPSIVYCRRA